MSEIVRKNDSPGLVDLLPAMPNEHQTWHCFASPEIMVDYLAGIPRGSFWEETGTAGDDLSFTGGVTYKQAQDMVRQGWQEGAERVARLRDKIAVSLPLKQRLDQFHVAGALVDVPRYLSGNPMCMKRPVPRVNRARPILTLVNHMGGTAHVPAECFVNRAAVVAAIVDAIEGNGYSCHVVGLSTSEESGYLCGTVVTIKEPGDVPDVAKMAFALGHVGMFRRLVFAVRGSDRANRLLGSGLGRTCDFLSLDVPGTFVLPSMNKTEQYFTSEQGSATSGLEAMLAALRAQDCPAFPANGVGRRA